MIELLTNPAVWAAFLTLTTMEIVLGIDNIVFISVLVSRLPREQAERARRLGLLLALVFRIILLLLITWIIGLKEDVFTLFGQGLSWKDLILIAGGGFLLYKATHEMHATLEEDHEADLKRSAGAAFNVIIAQIIVIDMVFSIDSIITAVGMVPPEWVAVMIAAVIVAVGVMFVASGPIARFVADHPTTKVLALAFLLLIGVSLVADGLGFHFPKEYIYAAMAFSVGVEAFNIYSKNRRLRLKSAAGKAAVPHATTGAIAAEAATAVRSEAPKPKPKSTPTTRARARPKSAPRKKS
jgi:predicted tellurium resistance membrane protein TerC